MSYITSVDLEDKDTNKTDSQDKDKNHFMAIASDADETSTGSSGNPVENNDTNMLADTSQNSTIHHYYKKLKDFAFDMPAGWTDLTISLFIDSFKFYKEDFSRPQPDELKIWQKVVKRCVDRSNSHKVFTVNSVMELAGSLKSFVLRNEYRKDDETFKLLYNDVVDILTYFPNTTCDSVSQNLRLRQRNRTQPADAKASEPSTSQSDTAHLPTNVNSIILQCCEALNLNKSKYFSNSSWSNMSKKIEENHNIKIDLKRYLQNMKKKLLADWKAEPDPDKRKKILEEAVGPLVPYFDLMPPRTIKYEDFMETDHQPTTDNGDSSDDLMETLKELQKSEPPEVDGPRVYKRATPKRPPGNITLDGFPKISQILGVSETCQSSESDEPNKTVRIPIPVKSNTNSSTASQHKPVQKPAPSEDLTSDSVTSPDTPIDGDPPKKIITPKKRNSTEIQAKSRLKKPRILSSDDESYAARSKSTRVTKRPLDTSKPTRTTALRKSVVFEESPHSSEDDSSPSRNVRSKGVKRPLSTRTTSSRKNVVFDPQDNKNQNRGERNIIFKTQAKVELSPLKMARNNEAIAGTSNPRSQVIMSSNVEPMETSPTNGDAHHEPRSIMKTKNIVAPINVQASSSSMDQSYSRGEGVVRPRSRSPIPRANINQEFNRLKGMDETTYRLIEDYKEKVKNNSNSVMKLLPQQHVVIPPVGVSTTADSDLQLQTISKPPVWFDSFMTDYKKHEMWKMHQVLKMQQELVDMENRKLNVLEKILSSLNDKK